MVSQGESADRGGSLTQQSLTPPRGLPPSAGKRPEGPRFRKLRHKHRTCHDRGIRTLFSPPSRALSPVYNPVVVADRERGTSGTIRNDTLSKHNILGRLVLLQNKANTLFPSFWKVPSLHYIEPLYMAALYSCESSETTQKHL